MGMHYKLDKNKNITTVSTATEIPKIDDVDARAPASEDESGSDTIGDTVNE